MTLLEPQRRRGRLRVYLDGAYAFSIATELAHQHGLHEGQAIDQAAVAQLQMTDALLRCVDSALRLLARRPHSERELFDALRRRGFARPIVAETVDRLQDFGYVDDRAFAEFWVETRDASSPRSKRLLQAELRRRGVEAATAAAATADIADEDAAYRAASRRLRAFAALNEEAFRRRLGGFLLRRGFSYAVAERVVSRCWRELGHPDAGSEAGDV
ncbi:MAG TPA: RecX family transcriptional regulator [Dehalococcoidia bacterium]|nr:RecX family transcriptional regulator [Dehalococcoidia bacterium]